MAKLLFIATDGNPEQMNALRKFDIYDFFEFLTNKMKKK